MADERLISALRDHDPAAVQELVDSYGDRLLRSACLLCGSQAEAQDLVQETFLQAFGSVHRFHGHSGIYTWLHAILLNLVRHFHRDRKRLIYDDEVAVREIAPSEESHSPSDLETTSAALADALRKLSAPHREVVVLRYFEDMKIHEIAQHLGLSQGTVKSRLHYAILELQNIFPTHLNLFTSQGTKKETKT